MSHSNQPNGNSHSFPTDRGEALDGFQEMALQRELQDAYAVPPLREKFVDSLSRRLDEAYCEAYPAQQVEIAGATVSTADTAESCSLNRRQVKLRRGLYMLVGLAASLLLAFGAFAIRDTYSWTTMLDAMRQQQWVEASAQGDGDSRFWISSHRRVSAQQNIRGTLFHDFAQRSRSNYSPERKVVTVDQLSRSANWDIQSQLLSAILPEQERTKPEQLQVVTEQWERVSGESDRQHISLRVKLRQQEPPHETLRLNFRCDPDTHLPVSCEVVTRLNSQDSEAKQVANQSPPQQHYVNFSYPSSGPQSIYALGVPKDAQVQEIADR